MTGLVRHCTWGNPQNQRGPPLPSMRHSFTLDLAVFSPTKEEAVEAQHILSAWLGTRGLRLSDEKTHIRHLREGFNFLGFTIRHDPTPKSSRSGDKLLIKPSQASLQQIEWKLKGL
jgi:RNA-directed DNA polymerase